MNKSRTSLSYALQHFQTTREGVDTQDDNSQWVVILQKMHSQMASQTHRKGWGTKYIPKWRSIWAGGKEARVGCRLSQAQTKSDRSRLPLSKVLFLTGTQSPADGAVTTFRNLSSPLHKVPVLLLTVTRQIDPSPPTEVNLCSQGLMA